MKRNTEGFAEITNTITGKNLTVTVNTRPQPTIRKDMTAHSYTKDCLTLVDSNGEMFCYTLKESGVDIQKDGSLNLYDDTGKPMVIATIQVN